MWHIYNMYRFGCSHGSTHKYVFMDDGEPKSGKGRKKYDRKKMHHDVPRPKRIYDWCDIKRARHIDEDYKRIEKKTNALNYWEKTQNSLVCWNFLSSILFASQDECELRNLFPWFISNHWYKKFVQIFFWCSCFPFRWRSFFQLLDYVFDGICVVGTPEIISCRVNDFRCGCLSKEQKKQKQPNGKNIATILLCIENLFMFQIDNADCGGGNEIKPHFAVLSFFRLCFWVIKKATTTEKNETEISGWCKRNCFAQASETTKMIYYLFAVVRMLNVSLWNTWHTSCIFGKKCSHFCCGCFISSFSQVI